MNNISSKQYLEIMVETNEYYVSSHNHDEVCHHCKVANTMALVARNMLRDEDFPEDVRECITLHSQNVFFTLEREVLSGL